MFVCLPDFLEFARHLLQAIGIFNRKLRLYLEGEKMSNSDRRYVRMESLNLLDYVLVDDKGEIVTRAMGRTLNISEKGILLENHVKFEPGQILRITIGLEEDLVDFKGMVKHAEERDDKTFSAGIEFLEFDGEGSRVLQNYLEAFEAFKN